MSNFDPSVIPGDNPVASGAGQAAGPFPEVRLFDPSALPGDNPVAIASAPAPAGIVIGPFAVSYAPDPNAAFEVTPGTMTGDVFTAGPTTYGPYLAMATQSAGVYSLSGTATDPLTPGAISIQPGDWTGGIFSPIGPAITGILGYASAGLDWDLAVFGPFVDIAEQSSTLAGGATEWVHLGWMVTDTLTGAVIALSANASVLSVAVAITRTDPQPSDWQPAQIVTRSAGTPTDGQYTQIKVGPGGALMLRQGRWQVWGQIVTASETIELMAANPLVVI